MKRDTADQKRKAEEEKIQATMEQAKMKEDQKSLERYSSLIFNFNDIILTR